MNKLIVEYAKYYSPEQVITVLNRVFSKAGLNVASSVLQLYYLARSPGVPLWAKTAIFASLGYFVLTPDAIPDVTPVLGFSDDLAVLTTALTGLASYMTPEIRARVRTRLQGWFGQEVSIVFADAEKPPQLAGEREDRSPGVL